LDLTNELDAAIDQRSHSALEINDPQLAQVVRRVEAGEMTIDHVQLE